jgi:aerobic-type carbon monoxide dehydrogenase small subunit (CoxS/CutS family)/carbon monoxide dehydrogenase subunit G
MNARDVPMTVNGTSVSLRVEPRMHLADALREQLNLTGTHLGCEQGVCGACTVLIDGIPQRSCIAYAVDCEAAVVTTIEGFDGDATMAALRQAFTEHHALQCGFCTPGMLVSARDIVLRLGEVDEARLREELSGNLCRCTGYVGIVAAVSAVAAGRAPQAAREIVQPGVREAPAAAVEVLPVAPAARAMAGPGLEERIHLEASPEAAWAALADLRQVAACLPGAVLETLEGERVTGRVVVSLGPVKAGFAGEGTVQLDQAARSGVLSGQGRDGGTGSSARGEVRWQVVPAAGGGSDILVQLHWQLSGALAQFNRAGLVQDIVRRLAREFAANLDAMVAGRAAPVAQPLGLWAMLWSLVKGRLFGR